MRSRHLGTGLLVLALSGAALVPAAQADPVDPAGPAHAGVPSADDVEAAEGRADTALTKVERVRQQLDAAAAEADGAAVAAAKAAEAWNGARWRAARARKAERRAARASVRAERARTVQQAAYRDVVITLHNSQLDLRAVDALISAEGMESLLDRTSAGDHVQALFDQQRDAYTVVAVRAEKAEDRAESAADEATAALEEARAARIAAESSARRAAATAAHIERRQARLTQRLASLQGISVELAQERQAALEAARAEARESAPAATASPVATPAVRDQDAEPTPEPRAPAPVPKPDPAPVVPASPPDRDGAARAIAFARAQLGERYVWGASGPDSWDCSGLTAEAWAAGGKSLPHYSVAQYEQSTPISRSQLRPGDLVFWSDGGPGAIFHVALYSGTGQIIHAPRTGRPVTEESMYYWRTPDYFARP